MVLITAVDIAILVENVPVVIVCDSLDVFHAAVVQFNFISVEYLVEGVLF